MLTELYIEASLVDEELADQVWETWNVSKIDDLLAFIAWFSIAWGSCRTIGRYRLSQ